MTLKLNGSSSGYTAIDAPATAGSNTLVLPANNGSANQVLKTDGSGNLTWVDQPTAFTPEVDQWSIQTSFTGDANPVTSGLARYTGVGNGNDRIIFNVLGSGMTESSGIFTFPSTGYWHVQFLWKFQTTSTDSLFTNEIHYTKDNGSNWQELCNSYNHTDDNGTRYGHGICSGILDIEDTSNYKVKFGVNGSGSWCQTMVSSNGSLGSNFQFTKIADT